MFFFLLFVVLEVIQIKTNVKIDEQIWRSINNHKTHKFLLKNSLTDQERAECDRLDDIMDKIILNKFKNQTYTFTIAKTETGYILKRNCKQFRKQACKTQWSLDINGMTGEASLECLKRCQHSFKSKQ